MRQSVLIVMALTALLGGCATTRGAGEPKDTAALEHVLEEWAAAWSSSQVEKLLPLFTDDVYYEDVTFGAVSKGRDALRTFAMSTFGAFADLRFEVKSRFVAANGKWGSIEWVFTGRSFATERSVGTRTTGTSRRT